jgi:hypothetical protein
MVEDTGPRGRGLGELAEDATGFGGPELRLTRDLLLRPRAVMAAYDAGGATAGGLYPKPLRYYLALNGLYLLLVALVGGMERSTRGSDSTWVKMAQRAGKSVDEFRGDLEQWMSLTLVPASALFFGGALFLLIRRWSPADDRNDFRQTFTLLNAYTLYGVPLGIVVLFEPDRALWSFPLSHLLILYCYARFGAGRWWRTAKGAWGRGVLLTIATLVAWIPILLSVTVLSLLGAVYAP